MSISHQPLWHRGLMRICCARLDRQSILELKATTHPALSIRFAPEPSMSPPAHQTTHFQMLIDKKADVNLQSQPDCRTPLIFAAINGQQALVQLLLDNDAEPLDRDTVSAHQRVVCVCVYFSVMSTSVDVCMHVVWWHGGSRVFQARYGDHTSFYNQSSISSS